jgi:acyl-coenzyme A synthetase/AMP-(fatty) acid ligase/SAM-dependent methyltransferase
MKIITPDCTYQSNIQQYKENLKHLAPGSRVLIKRSDPAGISEALIGNWELGLISIPVEPYFTPQATMDFITSDCQPHAVVNCTDSRTIFEFLDGGETNSVTDHAIFYTSGTTGNPKGVVQTRSGLESNSRATAKLHGFGPNSVHLTALPLYHCNAAAMSLFGNYFTGGTAVFLKKFTPDAYFAAAETYSAETANLVPTMVADLVAAKLPWPAQLRYVLTAATALSQEICRGFYEQYGPKLRQGYGLSEAINFSFTMPLLDDIEFKQQMVDQYPPVGLVIPGTEFRIVNDEVQIRGPNNMRCYWRNTAATNDTLLADGWLRTGDRGELRDNYLVLTGRFKEIIIKGGDNYSPVMIEDEFRRAGITGDLAVVGCQDRRLGEDIALVCNKYQPVALNNKKFQPAAVRYGNVQRTQTRKPQRRVMSRGLVSMSLPESGYTDTLAAAGRISEQILSLPAVTEQQHYLNRVAQQLVKFSGPGAAYQLVTPYFDAVESKLAAWWSNSLEKHIFSGLDWTMLMCGHPMGGFPLLAHDFCQANLLYQGNVLEIGAGVGNFSRCVPSGTQYTRTDLDKKFLTGKYLREQTLDINLPYSTAKFDTVIGVNVMHCAVDKFAAVKHAYDALAPGGTLLLGEGQTPGKVWALDILFGFIDGWWDRGGFVNRHNWLNIFNQFDVEETGYSVYREGRHDLGGLIWLKKVK